MFLEYKQVAAHLYATGLHEKCIGQTDCAYQVGMVHEVFTHEFVSRRVGYPPRRNESQQTALVQQFHCLDKKVVVYGLGCLFVDTAFLPHFRIKHPEIAEWDIRGYDIEFRVFKMLLAYRLEACRYRGCLVVQERQDKPCQTVLFKSVPACAGHGYGQETAYSRTRFEERAHLQSFVFECGVYLPGYGFHKEFRRVKGGQDGGFYAVNNGFPHIIVVIGICLYQVLQPADRLVHIIADGMACSYVQYLFDTPETGISG